VHVQDPEERKKLVQELHLLKTDIFMQLIESGAMPLRPGVKRLVSESHAAKPVPALAFLGCMPPNAVGRPCIELLLSEAKLRHSSNVPQRG